jgi:hypothetical protein
MEAPRTPVYLEIGKKRVFACALDWPGWCRSGRDEEQALAALAASAPRYAVTAVEAGLAFTPDIARAFEVVERLAGSATTDFGVPGKAAAGDFGPLPVGEAERLGAIVAASWRVFDRTVSRAPPSLAKGPRGGGRDRDAIAQHVLAAEPLYARKIGVRLREPKADDSAAIAVLREAILEGLRDGADSQLAEKGWPPRYAARRIAWHVLDHAWEIEDRGGLVPERAW